MPNIEGIVTEDISRSITVGQTVYDRDSKKIGSTSAVDRKAGYLTVTSGPFSDPKNPFTEQTLYIPFRLITSIDPRELYLSLSRDELQQKYATPPPRTISVHEVLGGTVAVTSEPSGYDGTPLVVERVMIDNLRTQITTGHKVYTCDGVELGTITRYDQVSGWMLIEKSDLSAKHNLMAPLTVVARVDDTTHDVYLVTSQADLERMEHLEPVDAVFVQSETPKKS